MTSFRYLAFFLCISALAPLACLELEMGLNDEVTEVLVQSPVEEEAENEAFLRPVPFGYFHPPKGWEIVESREKSTHVKMAFVKKTKKEMFCPSINLAVENVEGTLSDYLNDVKAIHEQDRNNHWRKLGKVRTPAGDAQLTEIDTFSHLGPVRMLQLILLKEDRAYILTAAALKKDFCNYYRDFQDAFHSLTITQDLFEAIPQLERRTAIKREQDKLVQACIDHDQPLSDEEFQKMLWSDFQKMISEDFEDMGLFWQALVLTHVREKISAIFSVTTNK